MKRRLSAILLAAGLAAAAIPAWAQAGETEAVQTEGLTEEALQELEEAITEDEEALEELEEAATEGETSGPVDVEQQMSEYMRQSLVQLLGQLDDMSDEDLQMIIDEGDASSALIAANWMSVRQDLGSFVEVTEQEMSMDGSVIRAVAHAVYDGVDDKTDVQVTYEVDQAAQTFSLEWEVAYPMSTLMQQAAMNTVMGLGIVFLTLFFLSWVIGRLHIIPDMVERRGSVRRKGKAPAPAAAPHPEAVPAPKSRPDVPAVHEEPELMDDLELVAVIAAAIAAAENTSADSFVVRSIKKANKRKWQNA